MVTPRLWLGLCGDSLTFVGGIFLSIDALARHREFKKIQKMASAIKDPILAKVNFTRHGVSLKGKEDVEEVYIHKSVGRAVAGVSLVSLGFIFLLLVRIGELLEASKTP